MSLAALLQGPSRTPMQEETAPLIPALFPNKNTPSLHIGQTPTFTAVPEVGKEDCSLTPPAHPVK